MTPRQTKPRETVAVRYDENTPSAAVLVLAVIAYPADIRRRERFVQAIVNDLHRRTRSALPPGYPKLNAEQCARAFRMLDRRLKLRWLAAIAVASAFVSHQKGQTLSRNGMAKVVGIEMRRDILKRWDAMSTSQRANVAKSVHHAAKHAKGRVLRDAQPVLHLVIVLFWAMTQSMKVFEPAPGCPNLKSMLGFHEWVHFVLHYADDVRAELVRLKLVNRESEWVRIVDGD